LTYTLKLRIHEENLFILLLSIVGVIGNLTMNVLELILTRIFQGVKMSFVIKVSHNSLLPSVLVEVRLVSGKVF